MAQTIRALALAGALAGNVMSAPAMATAPVAAPPIPFAFAASRFEPMSAASGYDCWRGCGWGQDRRWRRDRVDAGDVILGAVLIGGIAAIIGSENRRQRERDVVVVERDPYIRDRDSRDDRRAPQRRASGTGLDNAANMCVDRIERDQRVDTVDNVARMASGWQVTGLLAGGASFDCRIGNGGRIEAVDYGEGFAGSAASAGGQWNDESYAAARTALGGTVRPDIAVQESTVQVAQGRASSAPRAVSDRMPTYPGGPIPGEEIPEKAPDQ
jgi:hypothetical protein